MSDRYDEQLGTYTLWASAFSDEGLKKSLRDQALLQRGMLREDAVARVTPAQPTRRAYDAIRATRDEQDNREWNSDTGFSGVSRTPPGPGMVGYGVQTEGQKRRRATIALLDDGF